MLWGLALTLPVTIILCLGMSDHGYNDLDILDPTFKRALPLRPLLAMVGVFLFACGAIYLLTT